MVKAFIELNMLFPHSNVLKTWEERFDFYLSKEHTNVLRSSAEEAQVFLWESLK